MSIILMTYNTSGQGDHIKNVQVEYGALTALQTDWQKWGTRGHKSCFPRTFLPHHGREGLYMRQTQVGLRGHHNFAGRI